jgi:hypothetical protein
MARVHFLSFLLFAAWTLTGQTKQFTVPILLATGMVVDQTRTFTIHELLTILQQEYERQPVNMSTGSECLIVSLISTQR